MVEVRFACIPSVGAVKCALNGVTKYSDDLGLSSFFVVSQGAHTYSVEAPFGWYFVSGEDVFGRPLAKSGTTIIEWVPIPGEPWPEDQPWLMAFTFAEGEAPIKASNTLGKAGSILAVLGFVGLLFDSARRR